MRHLVLGVAVDVKLQAVHAAGGVVAVGAVQVDANAVGRRAEAHSMETLPAEPVDGEPLPTHFVSLAEQRGVAVVALGREAVGVDGQQILARLRSGQAVARGPGNPPPPERRRLPEQRSGVEQALDGLLDHLNQ